MCSDLNVSGTIIDTGFSVVIWRNTDKVLIVKRIILELFESEENKTGNCKKVAK